MHAFISNYDLSFRNKCKLFNEMINTRNLIMYTCNDYVCKRVMNFDFFSIKVSSVIID